MKFKICQILKVDKNPANSSIVAGYLGKTCKCVGYRWADLMYELKFGNGVICSFFEDELIEVQNLPKN